MHWYRSAPLSPPARDWSQIYLPAEAVSWLRSLSFGIRNRLEPVTCAGPIRIPLLGLHAYLEALPDFPFARGAVAAAGLLGSSFSVFAESALLTHLLSTNTDNQPIILSSHVWPPP